MCVVGGKGRDDHLTVASPRVILFLKVFPLFVSFSFRETSYRTNKLRLTISQTSILNNILTCFSLSNDSILVIEVIAVLNFSTAFSSSCSSTKEGLAGILGGGCIPSDLGIPITTSYITPHAVLCSCVCVCVCACVCARGNHP